jgi:hypothetical protein
VTVDQTTRRSIDNDGGDEANFIKHSRQCLALTRWMPAPIGWISQQLIG